MEAFDDIPIKAFAEEAYERLQSLESLLVKLEAAPDAGDVVAQVARDIHTVKGSAGMLDASQTQKMAHSFEEVIASLHGDRIEPSPDLFSLLLESVDKMRELVRVFSERKDPSDDWRLLFERLQRCARGESFAVMDGAGTEASPSQREKPTTSSFGDRQTLRVDIGKLDEVMNLVSEAAISHVKSEGYLQEVRGFVSLCEEADGACQNLKENLLAAAPRWHPGMEDRISADTAEMENAIRLLRKGLRSFRIRYDADISGDRMLLSALQQELGEIRMVPLASLFGLLPRTVRDLAQKRGKKVHVEISGEDTHLDQKIVEIIEGPIVHILRNAVDHGIESPHDRKSLGKPEEGTIRITATREAQHVQVSVADDGSGLNIDKIKEHALRMGAITADQAAEISDREAVYLICVKGFSTADQVTDVSGRGVGMDVVKNTIDECKGELEIDAVGGRGTSITMRLPLTLAVTRVVVVEVGEHRYCIPTLSVEEMQLLTQEHIRRVAERIVAKVGRRTIPLVPLCDLLGIPGQSPLGRLRKVPVVFLGHARQRIALAVDGLIGEQQVVVKSLGPILSNVANVAGATILATGRVAPILHPPDLMKYGLAMAGKVVPTALVSPEKEVGPSTDGRILVVDDMLSTRELVRGILSAADYSVDVAINGKDAWEKAKETPYGLFFIDLQMPEMNGWELLSALRNSQLHESTPVVILSSLASAEDRRKGLDLGADVHLTKSDFSQDVLLGLASRFLGGEK